MKKKIELNEPLTSESAVTQPLDDQHLAGTNEDQSTSSDTKAGQNQQASDLALELEEQKNLYLRTLADFQNFKRRSEEQRLDTARFAIGEFALSLLSVVDNFERALTAAEKTKSYDALISGVTLTQKQLNDILRKHHVLPIEADGQPFDPNVHEAIMRDASSELPADTVVQVLQNGYTLHGRVLRPAQVKVAGE